MARQAGKKLLATFLIDSKALASKQRYIVKQVHKLIAAEAEVASEYAFAFAERQPLPPYFEERFDRTTVGASPSAAPTTETKQQQRARP